MGVYLCNEGLYPEVADILSTDGRDVHYRPYADCGVCITAKVNCTIDKIGFLGGYISGSLWIAQGTTPISYDANTKVEYSITSYIGEFTLPTPYEMQANTDYVIIVNGSGPRYNYETPFPKDCENIIYKHAVYAGASTTDRKFFITTITTTQTGTYLEEKPLQNAYIGEYTLYEGANGKIVHKSASGEIRLVPTSGTTIKIQDKDVGSTTAGTTSASYGEWYNFTSIPTAPSGYHVPTRTEWQDLMNLWQQITGSNSDDLIMQHLLIPGAGFKTSGGVQSDIGGGLYWSSTSNNSSSAWGTRFYPTATYMDTFAHGKSNRLCVRCFKD